MTYAHRADGVRALDAERRPALGEPDAGLAADPRSRAVGNSAAATVSGPISSSKPDPGGFGRLRQQARSRSVPGIGWPRARRARRGALGVEHQVDAREARAHPSSRVRPSSAIELPAAALARCLRRSSSAGQTNRVRPIS